MSDFLLSLFNEFYFLLGLSGLVVSNFIIVGALIVRQMSLKRQIKTLDQALHKLEQNVDKEADKPSHLLSLIENEPVQIELASLKYRPDSLSLPDGSKSTDVDDDKFLEAEEALEECDELVSSASSSAEAIEVEDRSFDIDAAPAIASPAMDSQALAAEIHDDIAIENEPVELGASAPKNVTKNQPFTLTCLAYIKSKEPEIKKIIEEAFSEDRHIVGVKARMSRWKIGSKISIELFGEGLECEEPLQHWEWDGEYLMASFDVSVNASFSANSMPAGFDLFVDDIKAGIVRFTLQVGNEVDSKDDNPVYSKVFNDAFASYSSKDRDRVLDRAASIEISTGMKVFVDCESLRTSSEWQPQLQHAILGADLFLLFWSKSAAISKWVTAERELALEKKGIEAMEIHALDPFLDPPPGLESIHFGSAKIAIRDSYVRSKKQSKSG